MRSSKSRSRSKQNRPRTLGNIINRVFDSSGPEGKVRGTPQQVIEKYQQLARDAQLSNDRVAAENFSQHAEHYTRLLAEAQREMAAEQEARQQQYAQNGNPNGGHYNNNNNNNNSSGNRDRDSRDNRPWREDRSADSGNGDQPDVPAAIDFADGDSGLVETPEAAKDPNPRREERPRRNDRNDGRERNRNRDENRPERGARPAEATAPAQVEPAPAASPQVTAVAEPVPTAVPAPVPVATETDAPAKPRRPRAPRKPKDAGATDGSGPREAAE